MSDNNLIPFNNSIIESPKSQLPKTIVSVTYRKIDDKYYGFYYNLDDDVTGSMEETAFDYNESSYKSTQFDESVTKSERIYYISAAASGFLTGSMDALGFSDAVLTKGLSLGDKDKWLKKAVVSAASICGYKKRDYSGAVKFLYGRVKNSLESGLLAELSGTPNATGLVFSIIGQYTGELYSLDPTGKISKRNVPDHYAIGRNDAEKIIYGFLYWIFHMALKYTRKKQAELFEGIPKEIRDLIEVFGNLTMLRILSASDDVVEELFSRLIRSAFERTNILSREGTKDPFDLMAEIKTSNNRMKAQVKSVLMNECITRGLYTVITFCKLIEREEIVSIYDLQNRDLSEMLPVNNRIVSRMCLISSGVFAFANVSGAFVKALYAKKVAGRPFTTSFIASINFVGIGRFVFAVTQDWSYLGEDIKLQFRKASTAGTSGIPDVEIDLEDAAQVFKSMNLDYSQYRLLYSLENAAIRHDVEETAKTDAAEKKKKLHQRWQKAVLQFNGAPDSSYFLDEKDMYKFLFELDQEGTNKSWVYWMTLELALFEPYTQISEDEYKDFRKLKRSYDYALEQYALKQTIVSADDIAMFRKDFAKNEGIVNGNSIRKTVRLTAVAGTAVVAGSAAFAFAPAIAVALVGGAFPGLYGAALTNASLAFFGGGALAAGGLGMAGGSAVIAGGGALLGLTGSGTIAGITALGLIPKEIQVISFAKILTYTKDVLINKMHDHHSAEVIRSTFNVLGKKIGSEIAEMKEERNELNKELLSEMEAYYKCVRNTENALAKMLKAVQ